METETYDLVRGSVIRVTELDRRGRVGDPVRYAVSRAVARIRTTPVEVEGGNEVLRNEDEVKRALFHNTGQTIRYRSDVDLIGTNPALINLMTGAPVQYNASGDIVGLDAASNIRPRSFALEVWSKLTGTHRGKWGYTLYPFLKGGRISGLTVANAAINFLVIEAQTRRMGDWGEGPYYLSWDLLDAFTPVSGNTHIRQIIVSMPPPEPTDGVEELAYAIGGGDATTTFDDLVIYGGDAFSAGPAIINGGTA